MAGDVAPLAAEGLVARSDLDGSVLKDVVSTESASSAAGLNSPLDKSALQPLALHVGNRAGQGQSNPADVASPELAVRQIAEALRNAESGAAVKLSTAGQAVGVEQSVVDPAVPSAAAHAEVLLAAVQRGNEQLTGQSQQVAAIDGAVENMPGAVVENIIPGVQQGGGGCSCFCCAAVECCRRAGCACCSAPESGGCR